MDQHTFPSYNKHTARVQGRTLMGGGDNVGEAVCVWSVEGYTGTLYFQLNFVVNLKLL